jgi:hypothetical protein
LGGYDSGLPACIAKTYCQISDRMFGFADQRPKPPGDQRDALSTDALPAHALSAVFSASAAA